MRRSAGARAALGSARERAGTDLADARRTRRIGATRLLRNDSLRGRLAGTFAADLLGWARLL